MRVGTLCFWICVFTSNAMATTRAPSSVEENSLLYWRYLCREQPQVEVVSAATIELSCPNQSWKVKAGNRDGRVSEVLQDVP